MGNVFSWESDKDKAADTNKAKKETDTAGVEQTTHDETVAALNKHKADLQVAIEASSQCTADTDAVASAVAKAREDVRAELEKEWAVEMEQAKKDASISARTVQDAQTAKALAECRASETTHQERLVQARETEQSLCVQKLTTQSQRSDATIADLKTKNTDMMTQHRNTISTMREKHQTRVAAMKTEHQNKVDVIHDGYANHMAPGACAASKQADRDMFAAGGGVTMSAEKWKKHQEDCRSNATAAAESRAACNARIARMETDSASGLSDVEKNLQTCKAELASLQDGPANFSFGFCAPFASAALHGKAAVKKLQPTTFYKHRGRVGAAFDKAGLDCLDACDDKTYTGKVLERVRAKNACKNKCPPLPIDECADGYTAQMTANGCICVGDEGKGTGIVRLGGEATGEATLSQLLPRGGSDLMKQSGTFMYGNDTQFGYNRACTRATMLQSRADKHKVVFKCTETQPV